MRTFPVPTLPAQKNDCASATKDAVGIGSAAPIALLLLLIGASSPALAANNGVIQNILDSKEVWGNVIFGLLAGTMLTACCYLFFIWIVFRNFSQLLLIFMLLLLTNHMVFANDTVMSMVGMTDPVVREMTRNLSMLLFFLVCIFFTIDFLDLESHMPTMRQALFGLMVLEIAALAAGVFFAPAQIDKFLPLMGAATLSLLLFVGLKGMSLGIPGSITHIVAFLVFLSGALVRPLQELGYLNIPINLDNMIYIAAAVAAIVFAAVISGQFTAEREIKERALQQSNERFLLAAQAANEGLYDWTLASGRVYFSDRCKRIVGHNLKGSVKGLKHLWRMIDAADRPKLRQTLRQFRRSGKNTLSAEFRLARPDGHTLWLFATAVAVRDHENGKIIRLVGSIGDITAKKRSEWAMRLSEARFRSITEAHPVPVMIVKLGTGQIMYASPGAEPLMGVPPSGLFGSNIHKFFADGTAEMLAEIAAQKQLNMKEMVLHHQDGRSTPVAVSARVIDYQGEMAAVLGLYDLSDRKQAEEQIVKQQEALQQSEKMAALGGLLAGVAHELNNPLSVIVGQATLLKESSKEPKTISRGEKIFTAAERCSRIVKSFLAIARRKPPEHKLMQVNEAVSQGLELLTYQLRTENVQLTLELDPNLPQIIGDQDQFTQVISNLVLNGAQAMQAWTGPRNITVKSYLSGSPQQVYLTIADTGPGIPKEIRARVFEPFYTTKAPGTGTGVGLSLCLNIVVAHNGHLDLQDTPGGGATFVITLPIPGQSQQIAAVESAVPEAAAAKKSLRLLLVDDEFELAQTLADLLAEHGHTFDFAINGQVALDKLRSKEFDLILSDMRMPVMDGPTMYREICKDLPRYKNRTIFLTGDTLTTFVSEFLQENPVRFIEKPYTMPDVHRAIAEQLKEVESGARSADSA
ncbi:MAG: ATP-binding protein [Alphaproteobacteria bacterium]